MSINDGLTVCGISRATFWHRGQQPISKSVSIPAFEGTRGDWRSAHRATTLPQASGRRFRNREIKARQWYVESNPEITRRAVTRRISYRYSQRRKSEARMVTRGKIPFEESTIARSDLNGWEGLIKGYIIRTVRFFFNKRTALLQRQSNYGVAWRT